MLRPTLTRLYSFSKNHSLKFLFCLSFLSLGLFVHAQKNETYEEIDKLIAAEDFKKAEKALKVALKSNPDNASYHILAGRIYMFTQRGQDAFQSLSKAIALDPKSAEAYYERSVLYALLEDFAGCVQDANEALKRTTNDSLLQWIRLNRGTCYTPLQRFDDAMIDYDWILEKDSNNIGALNDKAMLLETLGRKEDGVLLMKRIIALEPESYYGYLNLGFLLSSLERYEEALPYFNQSLELLPKQPFALNNLGYCLFKLGRIEEAKNNIEQSLKELPQNSYAYRNLALIAIEEGQMEEACKHLSLAIAYNFTTLYGSEVKELKEKYCR